MNSPVSIVMLTLSWFFHHTCLREKIWQILLTSFLHIRKRRWLKEDCNQQKKSQLFLNYFIIFLIIIRKFENNDKMKVTIDIGNDNAKFGIVCYTILKNLHHPDVKITFYISGQISIYSYVNVKRNRKKRRHDVWNIRQSFELLKYKGIKGSKNNKLV